MNTTLAILFGIVGMVLHELGHAGATLACGLKVRKFGVSWKGVYVVRQSGTSMQNRLVTLAGPVTNLLLACSWPIAPKFAFANLILGVFNLLPLKGSDGSRIFAGLKSI